MNTSSKGPVTICTTPAHTFDRTVMENLGLRAILSSGIGDHNYPDRIFSARITLPRITDKSYEALIFNFVVREDSEHITLQLNTKALTLLIFIYPRELRRYVNLVEEEFELLLSQTTILPKMSSDLLQSEKLKKFLRTLRKSIVNMEQEILLNYDEFTINQLFDPDTMHIESETYLESFS